MHIAIVTFDGFNELDSLIALGILSLDPTPLVLPPDLPVDPVNLYLGGGFVCFVLIAVLIGASLYVVSSRHLARQQQRKFRTEQSVQR